MASYLKPLYNLIQIPAKDCIYQMDDHEQQQASTHTVGFYLFLDCSQSGLKKSSSYCGRLQNALPYAVLLHCVQSTNTQCTEIHSKE